MRKGSDMKNKLILCEYCIEELRSRGEKVLVGDRVYRLEESEEENKPCEWCGEYDDLFECVCE